MSSPLSFSHLSFVSSLPYSSLSLFRWPAGRGEAGREEGGSGRRRPTTGGAGEGEAGARGRTVTGDAGEGEAAARWRTETGGAGEGGGSVADRDGRRGRRRNDSSVADDDGRRGRRRGGGSSYRHNGTIHSFLLAASSPLSSTASSRPPHPAADDAVTGETDAGTTQAPPVPSRFPGRRLPRRRRRRLPGRMWRPRAHRVGERRFRRDTELGTPPAFSKTEVLVNEGVGGERDGGGGHRRACELAVVVIDHIYGCAEGRLAVVAHPTRLAAVACAVVRHGHREPVRALHAVARHSVMPAVLQEMLAVSVGARLLFLVQVCASGERTRARARWTTSRSRSRRRRPRTPQWAP
uniref:U-box domain-containing protein n=1 Tax=Oryza meridionalis TaxID=40149 RepID=A0A0E0DCE3_9ORYZ